VPSSETPISSVPPIRLAEPELPARHQHAVLAIDPAFADRRSDDVGDQLAELAASCLESDRARDGERDLVVGRAEMGADEIENSAF
jgi:hypothetical protein